MKKFKTGEGKSLIPEQILQSIFHPLQDLQKSMCAPFTVLQNQNIDFRRKQEKKVWQLPKLNLNNEYNLSELLTNKGWIEQSIKTIAANKRTQILSLKQSESAMGMAFSKKYGEVLNNDDARYLVNDWGFEIERAKSHLNPKALKGDILHIGSDSILEPQNLHAIANTVTLVDVSQKLLSTAANIVHPVKSLLTRAENLNNIIDNSYDLYVALRVFNSLNFRPKSAIQEAKRVLRRGGSILLSVSNGYKAIDDTILPGQIVGTPAKLSLSQPFHQALQILTFLHYEGFHELFLVPGSAELFLGGTLLPGNKFEELEPIIHTESIDDIPLCFYSEKMPTAWLGNYSNHSITIDGKLWPTVEHYFQSEKFIDFEHKNFILNTDSPSKVKEYAWNNGSYVRGDWDDIRVSVMKKGLLAKFSTYPYLNDALTKTHKRKLIERSPTDVFWGSTIKGIGQNNIGYLLNEVRNKLL